MRRTATVGTVIALGLLTGCGERPPASGPAGAKASRGDDTERASPSPSNDPAPPNGWRWESFRDVEVAVPGDWGYDTSSSQRMGQWCIGTPGTSTVGRPGTSTLVGCVEASPAGPSPGTLVARNGRFVGFATMLESTEDSAKSEGDRTTVTRGGVSIAVQAEPPLREQIIATIRQVRVDHNGCPVDDPVATTAQRRPDDPADVAAIRDVERVTACKYELRNRPDVRYVDGPSLISSVQVRGQQAADAVAAIAAAPKGGGPDNPSQCMKEYSYGDDVIVLHVVSKAGRSQIYLRYSGCDHNGLDDGVTLRSLTPPAVVPFVGGANAVNSFSGSGNKPEILGHGDVAQSTAEPNG